MEENYHKENGPKGQENEVREEMGWMKRFWKGWNSWIFGDESSSNQGGKSSACNVYFMDLASVQMMKLSTDQNARKVMMNFSDSQCRAFAEESTSMMILIYKLFAYSSDPVARDIARALRDSFGSVSFTFGVPNSFTFYQEEEK